MMWTQRINTPSTAAKVGSIHFTILGGG
jgi:hypothetical protein